MLREYILSFVLVCTKPMQSIMILAVQTQSNVVLFLHVFTLYYGFMLLGNAVYLAHNLLS